jgi:hypothetical protein
MDSNFDNQIFVNSVSPQVDRINKLITQRNVIILCGTVIVIAGIIYVVHTNQENEKSIRRNASAIVVI